MALMVLMLFLSSALFRCTSGFTTMNSRASCRYNCGYNLGVCSCSSNCWYYGTCCSDYYDYCGSTAEAPVTTDNPSCRYNCGYNLGVCSCSSNCRYYGTCCSDYYDYCGSTTETPITTDNPSCRYNCGYNLGVCSCSSTCEFYGNCCSDYYKYCEVTTDAPSTTSSPTTVEETPHADYATCQDRCGYDGGLCSCTSDCDRYGYCCSDYHYYCSHSTSFPLSTETPCGGSLTQSQGDFFSPGYPNYYPNNAHCTWTLYASELQVVSLKFTFVDLESCCDFIRMFDGPTEYYPLLAEVTNQNYSTNLIQSKGRYMTIVFTSDGSVTRGGFSAEYKFIRGPMCKDRCGASYSQCSCESSCERYGRCCHDYYEYCQYTTAPPVTGSSCWRNCGNHMGTCSCTSDCHYYGNCCYDFNDYCYYYTSASPVTSCGGRLNGSGSISSPYYPGYYHDNALCEWQLSAPPGQIIFLSIIDLDLERCCGCDYVNVYDGPSTASRLLTKVCFNETTGLDLRSSSSYMTILFRSDNSGVARGFKAFFSSSLSQDTGRVDCSSDSMNIVISKSYITSLGFNWYDLHLDDHRCKASNNYYDIIFNFPLKSCGTSQKVQNGRIVYSNNVQASQSISGEITRKITGFVLVVNCVMERGATVGTLYVAKDKGNSTISGMGHFNLSMAFYPSNSYSYPITEFPYQVDLDQDIYVQVQLGREHPNLHLLLDTCITSPNHDFSARTYDLIRNGCARDSTLFIDTNGYRNFARFQFRAFKFLRTHSIVFLKCDAIICADNDHNSRCRYGCQMRKKRSLSSAHHTQVVTLGPITLKGPEIKDELKEKN